MSPPDDDQGSKPKSAPDATEPHAVFVPTASSTKRRPFVGTGQVAGGAVTLGFGFVFAALGSVWAIAAADEDTIGYVPPAVSYTLLGVGSAMTVAGATLLGTGIVTRRRYARWADQVGLSPPQSGNGLIASGSVVAAVGLPFVVLPLVRPGDLDALMYGLAAVAAGSTMLGFGIRRRLRYKGWLHERGLSTLPWATPVHGGGMLGLAARF